MYPIHQGRRLRYNPVLRDMVQETHLSANDLIMPLFIKAGKNLSIPIRSMPQNYQLSLDKAIPTVHQWIKNGVRSVILFCVPDSKDTKGSEALTKNGLLFKSMQKLKKSFPELYLIGDLCFCEYTSHGHCGRLDHQIVDNPTTLELIAKQAVIQAQAGVDMIAPSGMMDGMVATIRKALDDAGYHRIPIMSYASKFASAFYGPFQEAAESAPKQGDRKSYQINPANHQEAIKEAIYDVEEGADIIMVKPAMPYLDILHDLKQQLKVPLSAYQVSGEFAMIKAAGKQGWIDEQDVALESILSIKRAGADMIVSYFTQEIISYLKN